jgi:hypothetical protein
MESVLREYPILPNFHIVKAAVRGYDIKEEQYKKNNDAVIRRKLL